MLSSGLVRELKASTSAWDTFGGRAAKLASQLHQMAAAFGAFVDALQTISDSANTVNGVSRDIGAALTRFCLRQRAVETAIRKWGETLQKHCADGLGRRGGEWRQTISDLERRHQRNCKRFKTTGGGKQTKNRQQFEAENRNFYIELLHAQRTQCTEFVVGTLLPVINAQMVLLDEGAHIQPILDSIEKSVNENDTARLIHTLLEDIDNGRENGGQRIGIAMAQSRAKSASQAHLYEVGSDRTDGDDHSSAAGGCRSLNCDGSAASLLTGANRNSMPPPAPNSHYFFSSCPSSAVATISSSSSSPFVVVGSSPPSKGNNCGGTTDDIWQQNVIHRTAPSPHHRLPLPQPFVGHQMVAVDQNSAIPLPPSSSLCADISPQTQNQCQKPPVPPNNWSRTTNYAFHQQNTRTIGQFASQQNILEKKPTNNATDEGAVRSASSVLSRAMVAKMPTNNPTIDQNGSTSTASASILPPPPPAQHADSTDSGSHCSSALMAETLQQIDQLGLELNNYCDGLDEINNGNGEERHRLAVPLHSLRPFVVDSVPSTGVRFRPTAATGGPQLQSSQSVAVPPRPPPPPPPPPLPPQRRNSAISSATPSAPSIAQLRSIGASVAAPFGASSLPLAPLPKSAMVSAPIVVPPSPSPMPLATHPPMNR